MTTTADPPAIEENDQRWRGAWVLAGILLVALAALTVAVFWLGRWAGIDEAAAIEAQPPLDYILRYFDLEFFGNVIGFSAELAVAALVLSRDRTNTFGWLLGGSVVAWMSSNAFFVALALTVDRAPTSPSLPLLAWAATATLMLFPIGLMLGFALFPNGRLAATGLWRRILQGAALLAVILIVGARFAPGPIATDPSDPAFALENPVGLDVFSVFTPGLGVLGTGLLTVAAVASIVTTYVRSGAVVRHQIKWVVAVIVPFAGSNVLIAMVDASWEAFPAGASLILIPVAIAVAVTKYRLYDIDVVISKTLVYASLALFIGLVYVGVVVGVGSLFGQADEPNTVLSVGATAIVAVAFQPVRRRMERVANRVVFGRKATPYEVLSEFSRRVAATSDELLDDAVRSLVEGTRAESVSVSLVTAAGTIEAAAWPPDTDRRLFNTFSFPIRDDQNELGSLGLHLAAGQDLQDDDRRLAEQLASGMGLALRNQLLTERLEARVDELRDSRRRLVAVQDETRRKIERDLHDGAQQQLVALKVKLGLGRAIAGKEGAERTASVLENLGGHADQAIDAMREFARGVYPPLLEAEGLASAIGAQARRSPIPVSVTSNGIDRYARDVEATVHFCVLEAMKNAIRHAHATRVSVDLSFADGSLNFEVSDDGRGFDPATGNGSGLTAIADRLDALTGSLRIDSKTGRGTTVVGTLPVASNGSTA